VKNRELLRQELRAEWIVEIVDHLKEKICTSEPAVQGPASKTPLTTSKMREALGHAHYETGRAHGAAGKASEEAKRVDEFAATSYRMGFKRRSGGKAGPRSR
jgi:hypothetical protein